MTRYNITFTRSDAMAETHGPLDVLTLTADDFVQLTYEELRAGPNGDPLAFIHGGGGWYLIAMTPAPIPTS